MPAKLTLADAESHAEGETDGVGHLPDLLATIEQQRKVISECKKVLGDTQMSDSSVVQRIVALQAAYKVLQLDHACQLALMLERHSMQVEDLQSQIQRLVEAQSLVQGVAISAPVTHQKLVATDYNFLDYLERSNRLEMGRSRQKVDLDSTPTGSALLSALPSVVLPGGATSSGTGTSGGLSLRLKDFRAADKSVNCSSTAEPFAILELLNQSSSTTTGAKQLNQSAGFQRILQNHQGQDSQRNRVTSCLVQLGRSSSKHAQKGSARHTRQDSGQQTLQLSSKREYMDLCASPTAAAAQALEDTTLERASCQDDILGTTTKQEKQEVSDFDPVARPEELALKTTQVSQDQRENSFRKVGFFLEKIKERNSSLQERLNLSFKKSSRLDNSCISYRPTTSLGNQKQKLKGALVERECISLTRKSAGSQQAQLSRANMTKETVTFQQSETSVAVGEQARVGQTEHFPCALDGRKPQIVRQLPHSAVGQSQASKNPKSQSVTEQPSQEQPTKETKKAWDVVSPTNNYLDFLRTASIEKPPAPQAMMAPQIDNFSVPYTQQHHKSALSILECSKEPIRECGSKLQSRQSTNLADQSEQGPLFNFYQCTEVLHQLSTTSRGTNAHSSKNRSFIQRGSSDCLVQPHRKCEYSSLLKQRSNQVIPPQPPAQTQKGVQEHATSVEVIKLGAAIIQRASSLEMVPRLSTATGKQYSGGTGSVSGSYPQYHHQGSRSGSQSFWTQTQPKIAKIDGLQPEKKPSDPRVKPYYLQLSSKTKAKQSML